MAIRTILCAQQQESSGRSTGQTMTMDATFDELVSIYQEHYSPDIDPTKSTKHYKPWDSGSYFTDDAGFNDTIRAALTAARADGDDVHVVVLAFTGMNLGVQSIRHLFGEYADLDISLIILLHKPITRLNVRRICNARPALHEDKISDFVHLHQTRYSSRHRNCVHRNGVCWNENSEDSDCGENDDE